MLKRINELSFVIGLFFTLVAIILIGGYFLADAFQENTVLGTFGNSSRRFFHGPGIINTDFGMSKRIRITESLALEFRGEFFNIFNHTQFNNPNGNISSSRFGLVGSARAPRIGQLSAKFYW